MRRLACLVLVPLTLLLAAPAAAFNGNPGGGGDCVLINGCWYCGGTVIC